MANLHPLPRRKLQRCRFPGCNSFSPKRRSNSLDEGSSREPPLSESSQFVIRLSCSLHSQCSRRDQSTSFFQIIGSRGNTHVYLRRHVPPFLRAPCPERPRLGFYLSGKKTNRVCLLQVHAESVERESRYIPIDRREQGYENAHGECDDGSRNRCNDCLGCSDHLIRGVETGGTEEEGSGVLSFRYEISHDGITAYIYTYDGK